MSVKLNTRQVGDVTVCDVAGRITLGEGSSALRDALRDMIAHDHKKVLLNLADVTASVTIQPEGLRVVVTLDEK